MLDPEISRIFFELFETRLREPRLALPRSIQSVNERMAARGVLRSGMTLEAITEVYRLELKARAVLAWELLQAVLSDLGFQPEPQRAEDVKTTLLEAVDGQYKELSHQFLAGAGGLIPSTGPIQLKSEADNIQRDLRTQVDLLTARLARQTTRNASGPVYNFHAPVGVVQSAPYAVANVSLSFSGAASQQLLSAMEDVKKSLVQATDLPSERREDIARLADEVSTELAAPNPSRLRITALATGIASAIQTFASMAPAYQAVKHALSMVGIALP